MADLDDELLERVRRWCAEAGRQTGAAEIRAALSPLRWDELLNARAILADPPPARPLGPAALADLARGTPADVAAEREREGRYRHELDEAAEATAEGEGTPSASAPETPGIPKPRRGGPRRPSAPVIHRRRDRAEPAAPAEPPAPSFERLLDPPGRAVLERLVRKHGARRAFLLAELAGWRTAHGGPPADADLTALLEHHGLARSFAHREKDELLHALRAARGDRTGAAARVGLAAEAYRAALDRLGIAAEAEQLREERRAELRGRVTLADRCRLLSTEADRLADLGILDELERDLRDRMGEHLRALRAHAGTGPLAIAFARSVSLEVPDAVALARRLGHDLGAPAPSSAGPRSPRPRSGPVARPGASRRDAGARRPGTGRPSSGAPRPGADRGTGRPGAGRPGAGRPGTGRSGAGRSGMGRPGIGRSDADPRTDRSAPRPHPGGAGRPSATGRTGSPGRTGRMGAPGDRRRGPPRGPKAGRRPPK